MMGIVTCKGLMYRITNCGANGGLACYKDKLILENGVFTNVEGIVDYVCICIKLGIFTSLVKTNKGIHIFLWYNYVRVLS